MKAGGIKWKEWEAVKCVVGPYALIAGISAGPRILSLSYRDGDNLLYEDHTGFGVGEWRLYGGHRFTIAPENADSYYPDNEPCEVIMEDAWVQISARRRSNGLRFSLTIGERQDGLAIEHVLRNEGSSTWEGALWAITCVPRSNRLLAACSTTAIHFWPGTDSRNWKCHNGQMSVESGNFRGKAGWHCPFPELSAAGPQGKFTISSPDASTPGSCVDNGSNVEMFVCADFAELETLSGKLSLVPGGSASHLQYWRFQSLL